MTVLGADIHARRATKKRRLNRSSAGFRGFSAKGFQPVSSPSRHKNAQFPAWPGLKHAFEFHSVV
jgi:hypothetical protein